MDFRAKFRIIMKQASYIREREYITDNIELDNEETLYWKKILFNNFFTFSTNKIYLIALSNNEYNMKEKWGHLYGIYEKIFGLDINCTSFNYQNVMFGPYYKRIVEVGVSILLERWKQCISFQLTSLMLNSFRENLIHRLSYMSNRALIQEMHILKINQKLKGNSSTEEYKDFEITYLSSSKYILEFFSIYPVLCRSILEQVWLTVNNYLEVFQRLSIDKKIIERKICYGKEFSNIKSVEFGKSDFHNGGQSVFYILLDNNIEIVYKPHSILCEIFHKKIFEYLLDRNSFDFLGYNLIDCGDYGWEEYLRPKECMSESEVSRYYSRFGILIFLNYLLHSGDLHYENLLAVGEYPVLIDCETILCNQYHIIKPDTAINKIQRELSDSILYSGLLPHYITGEKEKTTVNVSAISGVEGQEFPIKVPIIVEPFTSDAKVEYINPKTAAKSNLPIYKKKNMLPKSYLIELQKGFTEAYKIVLENKEEFWQCCGDEPTMKVRFLFRNTQQYSMLLNLSYHPDFLQDGRDRELLMGVLYKHINMSSPIERKIADLEKIDLLKGDIPYFCYFSDSIDILHRTGTIKNFYLQSSLDNYRNKVAFLNSSDLQRQQLYLQLLFTKYSLPGFNKVAKIQHSMYRCKDSKLYLEAAREIAKDLLSKAKYNNAKTDVNWLEITVEGSEDGIWSFEPLNMYLYNGLAGILVFLVSLKKYSSDPEYNDLINLLEQKFFNYTISFKPEQLNTKCNGAFFGESSIMYMYELLFKITGIDKFYIFAQKHSTIVDELIKGIEWDKNYDILLGSAGCVLVYLNMFLLKGDKIYLQKSLDISQRLLSKKEEINNGYAWKCEHEDFPLTGFSHGACGMSYTFMKLWKYTGDSRFLHISEKVLIYENSIFDENLGTWKDLRKIRKKRKDLYTSAAWCHGSAGILLGRMKMYQIAPTELKQLLGKDCKRAVKNVLKSGAFVNNCLCHGNAGNLEILAEYTKIFGKQDLDFIEDCFFSLAEKVKRKQWNCQLPQAYENPSFMIGTSGIGYALLRQYDNNLPEIISVSI